MRFGTKRRVPFSSGRGRSAPRCLIAAAILALAPLRPAVAGEADVISAKGVCNAQSICGFAVTIRHADEGWDHYADGYEVLTDDGEVLAKRVLRHPHVAEQPFTRPLTGVAVPPDLERVRIRAHDSQHGHGGREVTVELIRP